MVDMQRIFEKTRARLLRQNSFSLFKKNYSLPSVPGDKPGEAQAASFSGTSGGVRRGVPKGSKRKGKKRSAGHNGLADGASYNEISLRGRQLSLREFNEFRHILSNEIPVLEVDWEKTDEDPRLQARLYAHLTTGLIRIKNIPKIPLSYEPRNCMFLGLDTEDNSHGYPHFYQIATRDSVYISSSFRLLMRYIVQRYHLKGRNHVCWSTNCEYEFGNITKDYDNKFELTKVKWRRGRLTRFDIVYNPKKLSWAGEDDVRGDLRVWDTLNHWPTTVKEMGKFLSEHLGSDLSKLEPNYYGLKYAAMDAIISRSYACVQKAYYDKKGIELLTTPGATAMELYKKGIGENKFCHNKIFKTHTDEELHWLDEGTRGGRTEAFSLRPHTGLIRYLDINSAYPFSMKYPHYPNPKEHFWVYGHKQIKKHIECDYEGMVECEVDATNLTPFAMVYPYLGMVDEETSRFFFPLGIWKGKYTFFEIRKAQELGYKFKFHSAIVYERCRHHPFKDYVDFCYAIRLEGQAKKEKLLKDIGKSLGNNLYGKFGQRLIYTKFDDPAKYRPEDIMHAQQFGNGVILEEDGGFAPHTNKIWSAYITSICRDLLYQHMMSAWCTGNTILYIDTDGIFITGGEIPENDESRLGALKHEGDLYYFKAYLPKQYEYQYLDKESGSAKIDPKTGEIKTVYKAKGVPQWHEEIDENGKAVLDKDGKPIVVNLHERFFTTGNVSFRKPLKFREALRRKNIKEKGIGRGIDAVNAWVTVTKENKGVYTKREVLKNKWTIPIWVGCEKPSWYKPPERFNEK